MFKNLRFKTRKFLFKGYIVFSRFIRWITHLSLDQAAMDIPLERQRRALMTTVDYVERYMVDVDSVGSKKELLTKAFQVADTSKDRLVLEFGVFMGYSINHLAKLTDKTIYGFDSFEGLPERWRDTCEKGAFAVPKLPKVRKNVTLVKGWFNETLPDFLKANPGVVGYMHVDSDLYSSARTVLELLEPRLKPGSVIVFDDYFNYSGWQEGEYKAFMEFLERTGLDCEFIGYHRNEQHVAMMLKEKKK
ncbi:MAG TPA: class I SAM-dependent methyltransferase [Verrucomicrobiae bacterium]|nr:class I SAM-dependent methyltransferase [Verrucomicrobiae bacterium]